MLAKHYKKSFIPKFLSNLQIPGIQKTVLKIKRAPEPSDVLWENLNYSHSTRLKNRFVASGVALCMLCVSCFTITFFIYLNKKLEVESFFLFPPPSSFIPSPSFLLPNPLLPNSSSLFFSSLTFPSSLLFLYPFSYGFLFFRCHIAPFISFFSGYYKYVY